MPRRRIWCETLPHERLRDPAVLGLLQSYGLDLLLAVRPPDLQGLPDVLRACVQAGVSLSLWPMVSDADGRWASARNAGIFTDFARRTLDAVGGDPGLHGLVLDLEPSFHAVAAMFSYTPGPRGPSHTAAQPRGHPRGHPRGQSAARSMVSTLTSTARDRGLSAIAAVVPLALYDPLPPGPSPWQRVMGTPVDAVTWDHVSAMLYTSILEGWSRGAVRREDAIGLLAGGCHAVRARYGSRAGASLGAVGTGALGDEPVYRSPGELAEDVSIALACGVDDLALFDLGGVLARPPVAPWLDAFTLTQPLSVAPRFTLRARACLAAAALPGAIAARLPGGRYSQSQ